MWQQVEEMKSTISEFTCEGISNLSHVAIVKRLYDDKRQVYLLQGGEGSKQRTCFSRDSVR